MAPTSFLSPSFLSTPSLSYFREKEGRRERDFSREGKKNPWLLFFLLFLPHRQKEQEGTLVL